MRDRAAGSARSPIVGIAVLLAGCLLSFFLVGLLLIPVGVRLLPRRA